MINRNTPLYGPRVNYTSSDAQRQMLLAQQLLREGADTRPAPGGIGEVLARIGTAGLGGYFSGQAQEKEDAYKAERAKTLAEALAAGQGTPATPPPTMAGGEAAATRGTGVASQVTPGDPQRMAAILMGNPQTADMGAQLALGQMQFAQNRAAQKEDTAASQNFQREMTQIQQAFQSGQMTAQQAFAAQQAAQQRAHAAGLQTNAQQFQTGQTTAQQTFTAAENQKNRDAQAAQAQAAAALAKVPTGHQIAPGGGIQPIPGSPQALEAKDLARTRDEQIVATDRMIRSIDELVASPGREFGTGFSSMFNVIPGTDGATFKANLETMKSQAFLPMVAQLKGMGALSDAEGKKLTAAIGALDPSMKEGDFLKSLQQIKTDLEGARARMGGTQAPAAPSAPTGVPALPPGFQVVQ